jgi:zinc/manganese transport system substrate-binding protein
MSRFPQRLSIVLGAAVALSVLAPPSPAAPTAGRAVLNVVAAENFWGSLAGQLGGRQVRVTSIVSDPNADPHEYETNPADARLFASADYVIVNGSGYDTWADKLLSAQPSADRRVLTVSSFLGRPNGSNPHLWYNPTYVFRVIDRITADYESLEPDERSYFAARHAALEVAFDTYRARLLSLTRRFAGTKVASTESIFVYLASYLHLDLVTPPAFMGAVAEGIDPPASSLVTFDQQIDAKDFAVLVYNTQTVTPLTTGLRTSAEARRIPVIGISETMEPPGSTFQHWMATEFNRLGAALAEAKRT